MQSKRQYSRNNTVKVYQPTAPKTKYITTCPLCKQGLVKVYKDQNSPELLVKCTYCKSEWRKPTHVLNHLEHFHTSHTQREIVEAQIIDIRKIGWGKYLRFI